MSAFDERGKTKSVFDKLAESYRPPEHLQSAEGRRLAGEFMYWLEQNVGSGEMAGLRKTFDSQGLSTTFNAWVKTGDEFAAPPLRIDDIYHLLGREKVEDMARNAAIESPDNAAWLLTRIIPWTVITFTPRHEIPSDSVMKTGLGSFRRKLQAHAKF